MEQAAAVPHAEKAWAFWRSIGAPKFHVAPMVDQSELPFRMLCRNHGATAAYTPMLHARLFTETATYRAEHFTTCPGDRPLFVQFCANDPDTLLAAARLVEGQCDAVDLNLGCPQRIARRGRYGSFLMDDLPLVERLVRTLAQGLTIPVTVKIRKFPELERTLAYARMLEAAGACLVAVHGRTREQKAAREVRADWDAIRAVKQALTVPVLANGNVRTLADVHACLEYTGADGVMSAESLLEDPALFSPSRLQPGGARGPLDGPRLLLEYADLWEAHPCPARMARGHAFKLLGARPPGPACPAWSLAATHAGCAARSADAAQQQQQQQQQQLVLRQWACVLERRAAVAWRRAMAAHAGRRDCCGWCWWSVPWNTAICSLAAPVHACQGQRTHSLAAEPSKLTCGYSSSSSSSSSSRSLGLPPTHRPSCLPAGDWLQEHTDLRDELLQEIDASDLRRVAAEMAARIQACGRDRPQPKLSDRALQRLERERVRRERIEEQLRMEGQPVTPEAVEQLLALADLPKKGMLPAPYPPPEAQMAVGPSVAASS